MVKDIYALLVGIVDYDETIALDNHTVAFPALSGCVNDAQKMHAALKEITGTGRLFVQELYNSQATKENICRGFREHLCRAGADDAVLFYYSGHGTQEKADPCWTSETDGRLESLACFYDEGSKDHFLLADKELRYLLGIVAVGKPAITVIFDCCHSADATRDVGELYENYDRVVEKRSKGAFAFSQRKWTDFIFHERFGPEEVTSTGISRLLPEAPHLLFSAADSNQSAFEVAGEGVFTKHLLHLLELTKGYVSNQFLYDRLALSMRYGYEQFPRLYTPASSAALRTAGFLDGRPIAAHDLAAVFYNSSQGWIMNRGELHGLYAGMGTIVLTQGNGAGMSMNATVRKVMLDHALLDLPANVDRQLTWFAALDELSRKTLRLFLSLEGAPLLDAGLLISTLDLLTPPMLELVKQEGEADYTLRYLDGGFYMTYAGDPYRPLSEVVVAPHFEELAEQLRQVSGWTFLSGLAKAPPAGKNAAAPLLLEYAIGDAGYRPVPGGQGSYTLALDSWQVEGETISTSLRVRLTNRSETVLYVGVLYLDLNYGADTALLEPAPWLLEEGNSVELNVGGDDVLAVNLSPQAYYYNCRQYAEQFKIIVSDRPFDVYALRMPPLAAPPIPRTGTDRGSIDTAKRNSGNPKPLEGYYIVTVDLLSTNPRYDQLEARHLEAMLADPATRKFAEGLYGETKK